MFFYFRVIAKTITQHGRQSDNDDITGLSSTKRKKGCQRQPFHSVSGETKVALILNSTKSTVETLRL